MPTTTEPLRTQTEELFAAVNDLDRIRVERLSRPAAGSLDINPEGRTSWVPDRMAWSVYMGQHMAEMQRRDARLRTEILDYRGQVAGDLGWSHVHYRQHVRVDDLTSANECIATIVWERSDDRWHAVRWHATTVPNGSLTATE